MLSDVKIDFAQFHFNFYQQALRKDILYQAKSKTIWINRSIARGILTNVFFQSSDKLDMNSRRQNSHRIINEIYQNKNLLERLKPHLLNLSKKTGCPISVLMVFYCLKIIPNSRIVLGARNIEQIEQFVCWLPLLKNEILSDMNEIVTSFGKSLFHEPNTYFET